MADQQQTERRVSDLRATGFVALLLGFVLVIGGGMYPAMGAIGWLMLAVGTVCVVAWLVVRTRTP